jgi:hypothetical protein
MYSVSVDGLEAVENDKLLPGDLFIASTPTGAELCLRVDANGRLAWLVLSGPNAFKLDENQHRSRWNAVRLKRRVESLTFRFDPASVQVGTPATGSAWFEVGKGLSVIAVWSGQSAIVRAVSVTDFALSDLGMSSLQASNWELGYDDGHGWVQVARSPGSRPLADLPVRFP